jgi:hypothetical protein
MKKRKRTKNQINTLANEIQHTITKKDNKKL